MDSSVTTAARLMSRTALPIAPAFSGVAIATATRASPLAPSWSAHTPLSVWFWAAYWITSQTPGISAVQFQRQLGLSCYETAFQILHKLRAGMVRPDQDWIGGKPEEVVEADETYVGGRTR
ncbi:ISSod11, transposase, partial [mine drainage metagenome]